MAHQTDVHTVKKQFRSDSPSEKVIDPFCGKELERSASRHMVFRPDRTIYFCSRDCKDRFMSPEARKERREIA